MQGIKLIIHFDNLILRHAQRLANLSFIYRCLGRLDPNIPWDWHCQLLYIYLFILHEVNKLFGQGLYIFNIICQLFALFAFEHTIDLFDDTLLVVIHQLILSNIVNLIAILLFQSILQQVYWQMGILQAVGILLAVPLILLAVVYRRAAKYKNLGVNVCVLLGSGGHTTEICEIFRKFNFQKCNKVHVIMGKSDHLSQPFFKHYFSQLYKQNPQKIKNIEYIKTRRTNEVKQSKVTSVMTTLLAALNALYLIIFKLLRTTHIISNGPGICVPYFFLFWLFNKLQITKTKIIFIESWCRVKSISVAGRLVCRICDHFIVHWDNQVQMVPRAKYLGQII